VSRFQSVFAEKLEAFFEFRAAHGFKAETYMSHFIGFDRYCASQGCESPILTRDLALDWLGAEPSNALARQSTAIRLFGAYLDAVGGDAFVLPNKYATGRQPSNPYIFTDDEMTALFKAIDSLKPTANEPHLDVIAPALLRLTYTCGLRPNEGRCLLCENVNLKTGEILITQTKRNIDRIVVMSDDMLKYAKKYDLRRGIFCGDSPYFFPASNGGALLEQRVYAALNKAWGDAQRTMQNPVARPIRVYDVRHRFASACLNRWLDNGENLMVMLPYLRAYMGHKKLTETAYYIHILPENLIMSPGIDWDALNSILPEVNVCPD
jgi:integrase